MKGIEREGKIIPEMVKNMECYLTTLKNVQYTPKPAQSCKCTRTLTDAQHWFLRQPELDIDYISAEPPRTSHTSCDLRRQCSNCRKQRLGKQMALFLEETHATKQADAYTTVTDSILTISDANKPSFIKASRFTMRLTN